MQYTAYTDGACRISNPGLCSCGFIVYDGDKEVFRSARVLDGLNTNNVAEYSGLIDLLLWADFHDMKGIVIRSDSKIVVEQVNGNWKVSPQLESLRWKAGAFMVRGGHTLLHVRGHSGIPGNEAVDALCNEVLDAEQAKTA